MRDLDASKSLVKVEEPSWKKKPEGGFAGESNNFRAMRFRDEAHTPYHKKYSDGAALIGDFEVNDKGGWFVIRMTEITEDKNRNTREKVISCTMPLAMALQIADMIRGRGPTA